ncbi:hypothetical protein SAMN05421819_0613 [Bryocella elongata]|uniref:Uncharacterized protein n=1 Tax=Bryocella elongata TaxID=863522 RepID=A0A1H5THM3_9BACT|nr:hypothetical protein [Bryocella elongata]SEF62253.1 hypothetical protein SAMN05421819_0613 [Bryocella elongata]
MRPRILIPHPKESDQHSYAAAKFEVPALIVKRNGVTSPGRVPLSRICRDEKNAERSGYRERSKIRVAGSFDPGKSADLADEAAQRLLIFWGIHPETEADIFALQIRYGGFYPVHTPKDMHLEKAFSSSGDFGIHARAQPIGTKIGALAYVP